jgi:hypothetical protein
VIGATAKGQLSPQGLLSNGNGRPKNQPDRP